MKHIVCLSGGEGSALTALAVAARYPRDTILLNHDLNPRYEDASIKAYKQQIADYLGLSITYANTNGITDPEQIPSQFDVCKTAFKQPSTGTALCTHYLKTRPWALYLAAHHAPGTATAYYGFDDSEQARITNKRALMEKMGYAAAFPLAEWPDVLNSTTEIGIAPPATYSIYKHANCFTGNTRFLTPGGSQSLASCAGTSTTVLTRGGWRPAEIKHFGSQPIVLLTLSNGSRTKVVETTAGHRWITPKHGHNSFGDLVKTTAELQPGDRIPVKWATTDAAPDRAGIQHGFVFGDGSLYRTSNAGEGKFKSRAYIAPGKEDVLPFFDTAAAASGVIHGLPGTWKELPALDSTEEYLLGFIMGLVASDGSVSKSGVSISNRDESTLVGIQAILARLGLVSWIGKMTVRDTNYKAGASMGKVVIPRVCFRPEWILRKFHLERLGSAFTLPKSWRVESVATTDRVEPVYCAVVEGDLKEFTLDDNVLTGNCVGCLKAGQQHWYVVYCTRPDVWAEAKAAEARIGASINKYSDKGIAKPLYLHEMEAAFSRMKCEGVPASEHYSPAAFQNAWALYELPLMIEMGCRACGV